MLSRLAYAPLAIDPTGRRHLLVCDRADVPSPGDAITVSLEHWHVAGDSTAAQQRRGDGGVVFRSTAQLLVRLGHLLADARIGLRLYAAGAEPFLADVASSADHAGLGAGELFLERIGPPLRRVQCVHCRTVAESVSTSLIRCTGCGAMLLVRDHFSRRLGAYMGVQIDAEQPGDVPGPEPLSS